MVISPRSSRFRHCIIFALFFCLLTYPIFSAYHHVHRLVSSHSHDLSYTSIFRAQFQVYILTHSCGRFTPEVTFTFESVVLVPDLVDSPECLALNRTILHLEVKRGESSDDAFRAKYSQVLDNCHYGQKMKCLILEDDVVLLHDLVRTREVLVENTLTLFNHEENAYDCTKRGFGWLPSTHTGNGSQCRIFSKTSAACISQCLKDDEVATAEQLDYGLRDCQIKCGLTQKRFLLAVHSGLNSTMNRGIS
jgi:hypothetical protein